MMKSVSKKLMRRAGAHVLRFVKDDSGATAIEYGLIAAMISMGFDRGFEDPAVSLWMVMLGVQCLPYVATLFTATVSALSNQKPVAAPTPPALARLATKA